MRLTVYSRNFLRCLSALALLAAGVALLPSSASAQCTNPAGDAGDTMFNGSYASMQTCNGTSWSKWNKSEAGLWKEIRTFTMHACGIKRDNTLWCWGQNDDGQLGIGSTTDSYVPVQVGTDTWMDVHGDEDPGGAYGHTCGIKTNGALYCWGTNSVGQSGTGGGTTPALAATGTWMDIEAGRNLTCGIKTDGSLWCWGKDDAGQRGDGGGAGGDSSTPIRESTNSTWKSVTINTSNSHVCAIKSDDTAWCWGSNGNGEIGDNTPTTRYSPTAVATTGVTTWKWLSAGNSHTCGVKTDGSGWCWGSSGYGALGNGVDTGGFYTPQPVTVSGVTTWDRINAGDFITCGVKTDGSGWCWGYGAEGNIGDGLTTNYSVPTQVLPGVSWYDVRPAWPVHGLKNDGTLWGWGENFNGSLGVGDTNQKNTPVQIGGSGTTCTSPVGSAGNVMFNATHRVLQYCDGRVWQAAGQVNPGGPNAGCSGPAGVMGDVMFNNTSRVTQYCDGDLWRSVMPPCDVPSGFTFPSLTGQSPGTIESSIVQVAGLGCSPASASISGTGTPSFRVCADAACSSVVRNYSNAATTVSNGQYIQVRFTAANMPNTTYTANMTVGSGGGSFSASIIDWKFIFITSIWSATGGNLGGIAGADAWCNSLASGAGLPGTYMAWLSTSAADAPNVRFNTTHGLSYRSPSSARTIVANNWAQLTSGTLASNVNSSEQGGSSSGTNNVFSNVTTAGGNKSTTNHCSGWTSATGTAQMGSNNSAAAAWTDSATGSCNSGFTGQIYCVQQ